jgi:hypothetical protein
VPFERRSVGEGGKNSSALIVEKSEEKMDLSPCAMCLFGTGHTKAASKKA